jgi:flagellar hook-length control protein FliK
MQIRLDPPELGALQITVRMLDGVMSASFQTSNDHATQLLSHSLNQLKHGLESQGVSVDKIQVQQSPRDQQASSDEQSRQQHEDDQSARQEQQRKEMLRRMWRRLSIGGDPLDMVA